MLHNNHPIWDQDLIKTYPEYTIIFILFQEKDPVAKNNPDLHFNRSVVSTKKLLLRILFQIYSGYYYVHVCNFNFLCLINLLYFHVCNFNF